jgi:hypothetical protein
MTVDISTADLERFEAETLADWEDAATAEAKAALGMRELRVGGGVVLAVPGDPSGFWTRVLGLGFSEPITTPLIERITRFYREQGMSAARLQIAPEALPPDWADICAELNISDAGSALTKHVGDLGAIIRVVTGRGGPTGYLDAGLRFVKIGAERARAAGCDWLMGETGAERPGQRNPSLRNMVRAGMPVRYEKRNWIWRAAGE